MTKNLLSILICACLTLCTNLISGQEKTYEKNQLLVQVGLEKSMEEIILPYQYINGIPTGINVKKLVSRHNRIWLLNFNEEKISMEEMIRELNRDRNILTVQKNHIIRHRSTSPNDPSFAQQWQYINSGVNGGLADADIDADLAWDFTTGGLTSTGDTIVVAIIDDGVDTNHADIKPNLWKNYHEIPGNGLDDDANGYVDDFNGWNDDSSNDDISGGGWFGGYHGTSVIGIVGAKGDNNIGVAGVNWNVKLMIVVGGGNEAEAISAYSYVLENRKLYNETNGAKGAFVVSTNASWGIDGGQPAQAPLWCAMYDTLGKYGILNCGATANQNWDIDTKGDLPTACPSDYLIAVTNTKNNDVKETSAGYGIVTIDLGSPGTDTYTTSKGNSYGPFGGTSGATPHVTGTVGLLYSLPCDTFMAITKSFPDSAALLMRKFILGGVDTLNALQGITVTGGRLNMLGSVTAFNDFCALIDSSSAGIEQVRAEQGFSFYPNPSDGKFSIRFQDSDAAGTILISNILGEIVLQVQLPGTQTPLVIDLSGYPGGMYFVSLVTAHAVTGAKKIILSE